MARQRAARTWEFSLELSSKAPPADLFRLLSDAPTWPTWFAPARKVVWAEPGVRQVYVGPVGVRERVLEEEAPHHHAYSIETVLPVRRHRADVWLHPDGQGTAITWRTTFEARVPGTGRLVRGVLRAGVRRLARSLVAAAEA